MEPRAGRSGAHAREQGGDAVFRYALAVLGDESDAAEVARTTLSLARSVSKRGTLIDLAHTLCRELVEAELGADALARQEAVEALPVDGREPCTEFELAVSRDLDGRLSRADRASLQSHLEACAACARLAAAHRAQRAALRIALRHTASPGAGRLLS